MERFSIELKLYDADNEEKAVYRQSFIPFRFLKEAFKLQQWAKELEDQLSETKPDINSAT